MNPSVRTIGRILGLLVIVGIALSARVYASPVLQSQPDAELEARLDRLDRLIAQQNEQIESLMTRVAELECALDSTVCDTSGPAIPDDWEMGVSSETILRYQYDPTWELTDDEPGRLAFHLRNNLQGIWIHWMNWPNFVEELLADETQLREFEAELLQVWTNDDEVAELLSTSETTVSGKPALLWEMSFTADGGPSNRILVMHYDCGEVYTCEIALLQFGIDRQFRSEDHAMVHTLMSTLEIITGPATVTRNANLRACPGLSCDVIGRAIRGQAIEIIGQSEDGDWYQIASGEWISASLVDGAPEDIPVISDSANT